MKILSLNIRSGGGRRIESLLRYIENQRPDAVVLTEWRQNPNSPLIAEWANGCGLHHACLNDGGTSNGVFFAAPSSFSFESITPSDSSAGVLMDVTSGDWRILASYFPQGNAKATFFAACQDAAKERADFPFAIIGDFNTGNQLRDRGDNGERYACAEKFDALSSQLNLSDLWRRTNGDSAREWSWKSNSGNGFRIDHAFANQEFIDRYHPSCNYDHEPRELGLTDHSALIVTCMKPS